MAIIGTYMIMDCENCGTKYGAEPHKLTKSEIRFRCKRCSQIVTAKRPEEPVNAFTEDNTDPAGLPDWVKEVGEEEEQRSFAQEPLDKQYDGLRPTVSSYSDLSPAEEPAPPVTPTPKTKRKRKRKRASASGSKLRLGLTTKFLIYTILPLVLISLAVVLISDDRMRRLQRETINDSTFVVKGVSENLIKQLSETVARQTRQYLFSHPDLRKEDFNRDIYFKKVVLQKIGITGATSLYEVEGGSGSWITWADVDPKMVGVPMRQMKSKLGENFGAYWNIITGVKRGIVTNGVYKGLDDKDNLREKFLVCTPIDGTPYVISASIFMDEITAPLKRIEDKGALISQQIRQTLIIILGGGLLLIFLILLLYGRSLTTKIRRLAGWADAISVGELDSEGVEIRSNDEIRDLGEAITRMQDSIRLSLQRLRRRRG